MTRDDFIELVKDYGDAKQSVSTAYEWGTGILSAESEAGEYHAAIVAEFDAMTAEIERLKNELLSKK